MVRWTPFELAAIHAMAQRELRIKAISDFMSRSLNSVYYKTRREGIAVRTNPRWSREEIEVLKSCKTLDEASKKLGRTDTAVFNKAKRLNITLDCREYFKRRNAKSSY